MYSSLSKRSLAIGAAAVVALVVAIGALVMSIPPVVGLGDKVKLPLLHGGSTWVDLMIFALMGIFGLIYIFTRNERLYAWEVGFRAVAAPLWLINSVLGFMAALSTWDFSGSKESPLVLVREDPRLSAQIILLLGVMVLIALNWLVLERRRYKAVADLLFVVAMWALLANVFLDPVKQSLHPDSPVLNSGWEIRGPFFGIVGALFVIALLVAWLVSSTVQPAEDPTLT